MVMNNLETLRAQVRAWLDENVPQDLQLPGRGEDLDQEIADWTREFRRKLGAKGWLAPSWPKYYGGGGLPSAAGAVVMEELRSKRLPPLEVLQTWLTPLRVWGTEEQKVKWLTPTLRGEITVCQIVSEPGKGGGDLAFQGTTAIRNGSVFLVNGEKGPISNPLLPDYLFILVTTDPGGPRYQNMAMLVLNAHDPGVSVKFQRTVIGRTLKTFAMKDVRVPEGDLIGGERGGWEVAQTLVEVEHGGPGVTPEQRRAIEEREWAYWNGSLN